MQQSQPQRFTSSGFPVPNLNDEYRADEFVFVQLDTSIPYWPARIDITQASTIRQTDIKVETFNGPSISITINSKINETIGRKRRRKKITRMVDRSKILKWNATKQNGEDIDFKDIVDEWYIDQKFESVSAESSEWKRYKYIFNEWNNHAIVVAEVELKRMHDVAVNKKKRHLEQQEINEQREKEIRKANQMQGELYDGRVRDQSTGMVHGWVLRAGDSIRYWKVLGTTSENKLSTTRIIKLSDKYQTLRTKDMVPIVVQHSGNPPFWDTPIERLPSYDANNPIYYPLKQCKFIPSEIENEIEKEHIKKHQKFDEEMEKNGWGKIFQ